MKRIELTNMPNTRDLSYIYNKDGKQIKPYKLIRSGATAQATTDDIAILVNQYHLKRVIDFRTLHEINEQPDYLIDGIIYIFNPIIFFIYFFNNIYRLIWRTIIHKNQFQIWISLCQN